MKDERIVNTGISVRQRVSRILPFLVLSKYCLLLCCATLYDPKVQQEFNFHQATQDCVMEV